MIAIVLLVSALGLGLILGLLVGRAVRDASRVLQGALYGGRDMAMTANQPRGLSFFGVDVNGDGKFDTGFGGEDTNLNGVLDAGEDTNGNGKLDFAIPDITPEGADDTDGNGFIGSGDMLGAMRDIYYVYEDYVSVTISGTPTVQRLVRPVPNVAPLKLPPKVWVQVIRDVSQVVQKETLAPQVMPPIVWFNEQGQVEDAPSLYYFLIQRQQEGESTGPVAKDSVFVTLFTRTGLVQVADVDPASPNNIYRYAQEGAATVVK